MYIMDRIMTDSGQTGMPQLDDEQPAKGTRVSRGCLFCKSGKEKDVIRQFNLTFPNGEAVFPTRSAIRRTREGVLEDCVPLLPGYVFFQIEDRKPEAPGTIDAVLRALLEFSRTGSVVKLLRYTDGTWRLLGPDAAFAEMLFKTGGNIGLSKAYFDRGDRIRILDGFLKDYEGCITSVSRKFKTVEVTVYLHGKKVTMKLGYELVAPVSNEPRAKQNM